MKVMSKMGISTVASYTAAQAFEAIGHGPATSSTSTSPARPANSAVSGWTCIAEEVKQRHRRAYPENPTERVHRRLEVGGEYAFRREGELHLFTPEVVFLLQHSTRTGRHDIFAQYSDEVEPAVPRGRHAARPVRVQEGPAATRCRWTKWSPSSRSCTRFNTGAMSYGSISAEAHETMAIAMNNLGGRSNSGEGGEDVDRLYDPTHAAARSSRSRRAASASPATIWSTRRTSRSRWPRAPNPVRAASFRATRSIRTSPRPGTRRPASG